MYARLVVSGLLAALITLPIVAQKANWESIKPGTSTQADAIYLFGTPDYVEIELEWAQFLRAQAKPRASAAYSLKYSPSLSRSELPILNGPLGRASSALVYVEGGKVQFIQWDYCCIHREPARQVWFSDKGFGLGRTGKVLIGQKTISNGLLSATCGSEAEDVCEGDIAVLFMRQP
jgi:hypothetical protein